MTQFEVPRPIVAAFVLPSIPTAALGLPIVVVLPHFYETEVGLGLAATGLLFMIARFWDVFTDPLIGILSDRTAARWGRRKPWMLASVPVLMVSVGFLFMPPEGAGMGHLATWLLILYVGYTMIAIPHMSWGAELSPHYHERSRIQGWREFTLLVGMFSVLALPALIEGLGWGQGAQARAAAIGLFIIVMLPLTVLPAVLVVPDPAPPAAARSDWRRGVGALLKRPEMRRLLGADFLSNMALGITGTLYFYMAEHVLRLPHASLLLLVYFVVGALGVPLWMQASYRIGKHRTFTLAMTAGAAVMPFMFFLPVGAFWPALVLFMLSGVVYGAGSFLCRAIMADVADHSTLATGQVQTGLYFSLLTLTMKLGYALAVGLAMGVLGAIGFSSAGDNTPETLLAFKAVFVLAPAALFLAAGLCLWRFPLDERAHGRLRAALDAAPALERPS